MHTTRCEFSERIICKCTCMGYLHGIVHHGHNDVYESEE